jgi:hypothetical protein
MFPCCSDEENLCESEELLTEATSGGSIMSFLFGGLFANMLIPRREPRPQSILSDDFAYEGNPVDIDLSEDQKNFLTLVWSMETHIKKAEGNCEWVRLYCLLCTVQEMNKGQWKKFLDDDYPERDFLMKHMLSLLHYIQDMFPDQRHTKNLTQETLDDLEQGNLQVDLDTLAFTFDGKPLAEAFPSA